MIPCVKWVQVVSLTSKLRVVFSKIHRVPRLRSSHCSTLINDTLLIITEGLQTETTHRDYQYSRMSNSGLNCSIMLAKELASFPAWREGGAGSGFTHVLNCCGIPWLPHMIYFQTLANMRIILHAHWSLFHTHRDSEAKSSCYICTVSCWISNLTMS